MPEDIIGVPNDDVLKLKRFWKNEFSRCEDMMDERRDIWRKARKSYRMMLYRTDDEYSKRRKKQYVRNPILYTNVTVLLANLAANKPQFTATSRYKKDDALASMITAALEFYGEKCDLFDMLKKGVLDTALYNIGIAKVGYNLYETYAFEADTPFITRVSPYNFLVDPDATCDKDARWMGEKSYISMADLTPENGYINVDEAKRFASTFKVNEEINNLGSDDENRSDSGYNVSTSYDDELYPSTPSIEKRLQTTEIYDRVNRQVLLFAGDCDVMIMQRDYPKYLKDFPYAVMQFNSIPDLYVGMTDYEIIHDKIKEINTINNRMIEQTKRMLPKILCRKGVLSKNEIDKITDGKLGGVHEVDTPSSLSDVIIPMPTAPLDQSNVYVLEGLKRSMNEDTGIADFMKSSPLTEKRTATELAMVQQASSVRANYRQKAVDMWMESIATKLFYVLKHTMKDATWIDIAGNFPNQAFDENGVPFIEVDMNTGQPVLNKQNGFWLTPDVLQSEFRIKIEAGSTAASTSTVKQNQIMQAYSMFVNNPLVDQMALLRKVLTALGLDADDVINQQALFMQGGGGVPPIPPPMQPNGSAEIRPQKTQLEGAMTGNNLAADMRGVTGA
jgi:hypothetical protein